MAVTPFVNEPLTDFEREENRRRMEEALAAVRAQLGRHWPLRIGGKAVETPERIRSLNPSHPDQTVGWVAKARRAEIDEAVEAAWRAYAHWKTVPAFARARYLYKAAAIMRRRRWELAAWQVFEAGKPWSEADADVAEAIDFLEYYGRQMERLAAPVPVHPVPGEDDQAFYIPLGVGAIIPPWNFPLAILTGMTASAVVAGNTVVLKPSSDTPVMAAQFCAVMEAAGLPAGVINLVPGEGGEVGDYLVGHPRIRFISFTGSREVGVRIHRVAAEVGPGQRWIKRVIAEMGGKDAIIVDETADLAAAVEGIAVSAFGFQGQKCSACSRAIVLDAVHDTVLEALRQRVQALKVGPAEVYEHHLGPLINERAEAKVLDYIAWGKAHATLVAGGAKVEGPGYFVQPTIFADVKPGSKLEQEEIFGPVLSVIRARDWEEALAIANDTEYGLTGAVYTERRDRIEDARERFEVGNLYINRKCTGALVGVHPFGGFNLSGTNSKTGSPDYLLLLMQMKSVAERL
ncbi:MAG: L-glutamate gamma-semialdehyde dehydrogenase [Firmicutes bacterium]|nr:L-glutamate gamma-semialdehyde dehydrogenase [Alicyclobacillaceae bacterium]MCL6496009.1 L-glutamate gamma-semialdehyde dehydrogenase [Bacillota bacterium]